MHFDVRTCAFGSTHGALDGYKREESQINYRALITWLSNASMLSTFVCVHTFMVHTDTHADTDKHGSYCKHEKGLARSLNIGCIVLKSGLRNSFLKMCVICTCLIYYCAVIPMGVFIIVTAGHYVKG